MMRSVNGLIWLLACVELAFGGLPNALAPLTEYIFVSQPGHGSVSVTEVNALTRQVVRDSRTLIARGLIEPCGLAIDHERQRLYVADPKSSKVFMYKLYFGVSGLTVKEHEQFIAVHDVTPRWIAVDDKGTLFCTDEGRSFIAEVKSEELSKLGQQSASEDEVRPQFHKLYSRDSKVDKPGGIAVDGRTVYWGNRARGAPYGSLLSAPEDPNSRVARAVPDMIQALSKNVDKVYGVCASPTAIFYTGGSRSVYGAKPGSFQARATATVMLDDFAIPRGCVWDGDGTVYLADKGGDAVWSFPSGLHGLGLVQASKLFEVKDPYGVAVFRPSLSLESVGFLRGGSLQVAPALLPLLIAILAVLGHNAH